jgi:small-conductance mechanosensitive channel
MTEFWKTIRQVLEFKVTLGNTELKLISAIELILILVVFLIISRYFRKILQKRILPRFKLPSGTQFVMLRAIHYMLIVIGIILAFNIVGIRLTSLTVIFGLIGFGIAFGLQNITSNFISGIILLFERPISVGDFIEVDDAIGQVNSINMRATTITTRDNITLIVPNSKFIEDTVTNWSIGDLRIRIVVPVRVAYGSDTKLVEQLLLKAAAEHPQVLPDPEPGVLFREFGDSALNFALRVWIPDPATRSVIASDLNYTIDAAFRDNGIKVPFPQRDVHIHSEI